MKFVKLPTGGFFNMDSVIEIVNGHDNFGSKDDPCARIEVVTAGGTLIFDGDDAETILMWAERHAEPS